MDCTQAIEIDRLRRTNMVPAVSSYRKYLFILFFVKNEFNSVFPYTLQKCNLFNLFLETL